MRRAACRRGGPALSLLADDRLHPRAARAVREHLAACTACRREYEDLLELRRTLAASSTPPMASDALRRVRARLSPRLRRTVPAAALVAAALAVVALALVLLRPSRESSAGVEAPVAVVRAAPAVSGGRAAPEVAPDPAPQVDVPEPSPRPRALQAGPRPHRARRTPPRRPASQGRPEPPVPSGSLVLIAYGPGEAAGEWPDGFVSLRAVGLPGADGEPEAVVSLSQTFGRRGGLERIEYAYQPADSPPAPSSEEASPDETPTESVPPDDDDPGPGLGRDTGGGSAGAA